MRWALLAIMMLIVSCKEVIMHNIDEAQANKVSIILHEHNIEATKVKSGNNWNVEVDSGQTYQALQILDKSRFLKRLAVKPSSNKGGLMVSREERQRALERELAFNLEETLEAFPEILEARIHFYFNQQNEFDFVATRPQKTASVLLVVGDNGKVNVERLRESVTKLVCGATGIGKTEVSIIIAREAGFGAVYSSAEHKDVTATMDYETEYVMPPLIVMVGVGSFVLFLAGWIVVRKIQRKREARVESENVTTSQKVAPQQVVAEQVVVEQVVVEQMAMGKVEMEEEKVHAPFNTGDLKAFRYMNQELF